MKIMACGSNTLLFISYSVFQWQQVVFHMQMSYRPLQHNRCVERVSPRPFWHENEDTMYGPMAGGWSHIALITRMLDLPSHPSPVPPNLL